MNINSFVKQLEEMNSRLAKLYEHASHSPEDGSGLVPIFLKEVGVSSEALSVAAAELRRQNECLAIALQQLEAERQRYQNLFEFVPEGYLVTDTQGIIQEANRIAAQMLNVTPQALIGKSLTAFVAPEAQRYFAMQLQQQGVNQPQEWTISLCPRQGKPFSAAIVTGAIQDKSNHLIGFRWLLRDALDRKPVVAVRFSNAYASNQFQLAELAETHELGSNSLANPIALSTNSHSNGKPLQKLAFELGDRPIHTFKKGELIPLQHKAIWQVCDGLVKLSTFSENSEEITVGLVGRSMPFGYGLTFLSIYQAKALSDVKLVCIPLSELTSSPALAQALLPQMNERLRQTEALLAISGQRRVEDRLTHLLRLLKQEIGEPVSEGTRLAVRLTHEDIASACYSTRVTITRLLGKLQVQGKILLDSRNYMILRDGV